MCSGYRNLQELRVVDQSREVSRRLAKPTEYHTSPDSGYGSTTQGFGSPDSQSSDEQLDFSLVRNFPEPSFWIEGTAKDVFFNQYITIATGHLKTELTFVPVVHKAAAPDSMLENIISALGIAFLGKDSRDLSYLAGQKYSSALRRTQSALQNPRLVRSDETLATVLLLGLYDSVALEIDDDNLATASVHTQGAIRLLQIRDNDQIDKPAGARMFLRVYKQILENCLYNKTPFPTVLLHLQRRLKPRMNDGEAGVAALIEIAARLCSILAAPKPHSDPDHILEALHDLDGDLAAWKESLDYMHSFRKDPIDQPDKSFLTHRHVYVNHLSAATWNSYRAMRIRLHEEVLSILPLLPLSTSAPAQITSSNSIICLMSQEICQSIPFHLGQGCTARWYEAAPPPLNMYGGAAVIMPLYFASNKAIVGPAMHEWTTSQVRVIAKETGIAKAKVILNQIIMQD